MVSIRDAFPSRFLKEADLPDEGAVVTIESAEYEEVNTTDHTEKIVVRFPGWAKGLPLNKTNGESIATIVGSEETDDWIGHAIKLIKARVDFNGQRVGTIRIDPPPRKASRRAKTHPAPTPTTPDRAPDHDDDDAPPWVSDPA